MATMFQQNAQEINWILETIKIGLPTLTALIVPFITYRWISRIMANYQTKLTKEIEDYKKDITKELEHYKIQLQSDFQTKFYTFQTKFSLWHKKQEEVSIETFERLAELFNIFQLLASPQYLYNASIPGASTQLLIDFELEKCQKSMESFRDFYDKKRIYLDDVLQKESLNIYTWGLKFLRINLNTDTNEKEQDIVEMQMLPSLNNFTNRFKLLFSPENIDNRKLDKK